MKAFVFLFFDCMQTQLKLNSITRTFHKSRKFSNFFFLSNILNCFSLVCFQITPYNLQGMCKDFYQLRVKTMPAPLMRTGKCVAVLMNIWILCKLFIFAYTHNAVSIPRTRHTPTQHFPPSTISLSKNSLKQFTIEKFFHLENFCLPFCRRRLWMYMHRDISFFFLARTMVEKLH